MNCRWHWKVAFLKNVKPFATGNRKKSTNEASDAVVRKIWMMVELLRHKRLSLALYTKEHERDRRSFQRDLQQLRAIGVQSGFSISPLKQQSYVELENFGAWIRALHRRGTEVEQLVGDIARAMGQPITAELGVLTGPSDDADERFFHFAIPRMVQTGVSNLTTIGAELKSAWAAKSLVKFHYPDKIHAGTSTERVVEPYRVLLRSGVFYLVGYDRLRRGWRIFALDRFTSTPVRCGTNNSSRKMPAVYASDDVLGFIKTGQTFTEVTVELSPFVAASAISRQWQAGQRVKLLDGGGAHIIFAVSDLSEVARWAFGFGQDATIVAPPQAVRAASEMARQIADQHGVKEDR